MSSSFTMKPLDRRVAEATSVRTQLKKMGILMDDDSRTKLMVASNEFVKNGFSCTMKLRIDDKSRAIVHFRSNPSQQSGVILEYV